MPAGSIRYGQAILALVLIALIAGDGLAEFLFCGEFGSQPPVRSFLIA
jgi:hypothetical protein